MLIFRGKLIPTAEALIPADDHGFLYAAGGFESFRTFGGNPFLLEQHLARLRKTLAPLCIENLDTLMMMSPHRLASAIKELLVATGRDDAVFRYTVSAGPAGHHLPTEPYREPWDMLTVRDLPAPSASCVTLRVMATARDSGEASPRGKSLAYLNSLFAWREQQAWEQPNAQGLMLAPNGMVSEGVTCNVFWIHAGKLYTPSHETGILPGVHRAHLTELAAALGIEVAQGAWPLTSLCEADAIGTINAATGPVAVSEVQDLSGRSIWQRNAVASEAYVRLVNAYKKSLPA